MPADRWFVTVSTFVEYVRATRQASRKGASTAWRSVRFMWCPITRNAVVWKALWIVVWGIVRLNGGRCSSKSMDVCITCGVQWIRIVTYWIFWSKAAEIKRRRRSSSAIDSRTRTVRRAGEVVELTLVEYSLLEKLLSAPGRILEREELVKEVLHRNLSPFDRSIDTHVSNLRKKLGHHVNGVE